MPTKQQIEQHAKVILAALKGDNFEDMTKALHQFGAFLQSEFKQSDYTTAQGLVKKTVGEDHALKKELTDNAFRNSAVMFEAISEYYMRHAEEDEESRKMGDLTISHTIASLKIGLSCFKELVGREVFENGWKRVAKNVDDEKLVENNSGIISQAINKHIEAVYQPRVNHLEKLCEESEKLILKQINQLVLGLPSAVVDSYKNKESKQVDLQAIINRAISGGTLLAERNRLAPIGRHSIDIHPELHAAIKQYNKLVQLREILQKNDVPCKTRLRNYNKATSLNETRQTFNASTTGNSIYKKLVNFIYALKVSGVGAFWQEKNKRQLLQKLKVQDTPEVKRSQERKLGGR